MRGWTLYVFLPSEAFLTECVIRKDLPESNGNKNLNIYTQFCLIIPVREYRSVENVSTHDFAQFCSIIPVREYRSVENVATHDSCIPLGMLPNPNGMRVHSRVFIFYANFDYIFIFAAEIYIRLFVTI